MGFKLDVLLAERFLTSLPLLSLEKEAPPLIRPTMTLHGERDLRSCERSAGELCCKDPRAWTRRVSITRPLDRLQSGQHGRARASKAQVSQSGLPTPAPEETGVSEAHLRFQSCHGWWCESGSGTVSSHGQGPVIPYHALARGFISGKLLPHLQRVLQSLQLLLSSIWEGMPLDTSAAERHDMSES